MDKKRKLMQFYFVVNTEVSSHYHQNIELFYVLDGTVDVEIDDTKFCMRQGDIILINANKRHLVTGSEDCLFTRFEIDFHLLAEHMGSIQLLFWCNTVSDKNAAYADLRLVLDKILSRYFEKDEQGALHLNALYYEALAILTSNFLVKTDDVHLSSGDSQGRVRIRRIQNYIQVNYQTQLSLSDLAQKLFLSNAYLSKYIKKHFGLTFMEYLNNVRLFHAVDELLYTDKSLTRIAMDNGFPTSAAFTKVFRAHYAKAPNEYRKKIKKVQPSIINTTEIAEQETLRIQKYLRLREHQNEADIKHKKSYTFDVSKVIEPLSPTGRAVCLGDVYSLLRSDVQRQMKELKQAAGIRYVRVWNIFSREACYDEKRGCNFQKLDQALDFLLENQMKPYLELGAKMMAFMYTPDRYVEKSKNEGIYSLTVYEKILWEFCTHIANRYGIEEVESWYFEYWHHPDMSMDEDGDYYRYFDITFQILKSISNWIKIGGAGWVLGYETAECDKVLGVWKNRKIIPDFLSLYSYQYVSLWNDSERYVRKSIDISYIDNQIAILKQLLQEQNFPVKELHISEWNCTISSRNPLNDGCEQGAYILKNCIDMNGKVDFMAYWHALDLYSEYHDANKILNGDSGMISRDGIKKPSCYAYVFMNRLLPEVIDKNEHSIITGNGKERYVIACHNYRGLSASYAFAQDDEITAENQERFTEDFEPLKLTFKLDNVRNGTYLVKIHSINKSNGSVQDIWREMGYSTNLSKDEIIYLEKSSIPHLEMKKIQVENGVLKIDNLLKEHEIRLLDIQYQYTL